MVLQEQANQGNLLYWATRKITNEQAVVVLEVAVVLSRMIATSNSVAEMEDPILVDELVETTLVVIRIPVVGLKVARDLSTDLPATSITVPRDP